jgi:hypothetical protein
MAGLTLAVAGIASEAGRVMFIAFNGNARLQRKIFYPGHDASTFQHFSNPDLCNWQCKVSGNRKQRNSSVTILYLVAGPPNIDFLQCYECQQSKFSSFTNAAIDLLTVCGIY